MYMNTRMFSIRVEIIAGEPLTRFERRQMYPLVIAVSARGGQARSYRRRSVAFVGIILLEAACKVGVGLVGLEGWLQRAQGTSL